MKIARKKILIAALAAGATLALSSPAYAEHSEGVEVETEVHTSVSASTTPGRPGIIPPLPAKIEDLRKDAQDRIKNLRDGIKVNVQERADIRADIKAASSSDDRRELRQELRDERQEDRREVREERREIMSGLKDRIQALVRTHVGAIIQRSTNAIERFENLADRMESRIEKLKTAGANTASVEATLSAAVTTTATAQTDLDALKATVSAVTDSSNAEQVRADIRAGIEKVTASIKAAHAALLKAARELAQLSASVSTDASVSTSN